MDDETRMLILATQEGQRRMGLEPQSAEEILKPKSRQAKWGARSTQVAARLPLNLKGLSGDSRGGILSAIRNSSGLRENAALVAGMKSTFTCSTELSSVFDEIRKEAPASTSALAIAVAMLLGSRLVLGSARVNATQQDLAVECNISPSQVGNALALLQRHGVVFREAKRGGRIWVSPSYLYRGAARDFAEVEAEYAAAKAKADSP